MGVEVWLGVGVGVAGGSRGHRGVRLALRVKEILLEK